MKKYKDPVTGVIKFIMTDEDKEKQKILDRIMVLEKKLNL